MATKAERKRVMAEIADDAIAFHHDVQSRLRDLRNPKAQIYVYYSGEVIIYQGDQEIVIASKKARDRLVKQLQSIRFE